MTQLQMEHCQATNIFAAYYLHHHSIRKPNLFMTQLKMDHCRATNIFAAYFLHHHSFSKPNLCITQLEMDHCRATNIFAAYYLHHLNDNDLFPTLSYMNLVCKMSDDVSNRLQIYV